MYSIYLLQHIPTQRTYVGITVDLKRRLRQHNGEIKGGAKCTTRLGSGWTIISYISPFEKTDALRLERYIKKCRGMHRLNRMKEVAVQNGVEIHDMIDKKIEVELTPEVQEKI